MKQLTATDAFFVYLEAENTPMYVGALAIYDPSTAPGGRVDHAGILGYLRCRLPALRAFRRRLVRVPLDLDYPYWLETAAPHLEHHVRSLTLPQPGNWSTLRREVARLAAAPLDMSRPPWEFTVIEGLNGIEGLPRGCFALYSKVHHALMDGVGGAALGSVLHDLDATLTRTIAIEETIDEREPWSGELLLRGYLHSLAWPAQDASVLVKSIPGLARMAAHRLRGERPRSRPAPHTRFNQLVTSERVWDAVPLPLADFKEIAQLVPGATVNDVVLAIFGGALRTYLQGKGELAEESLKAMVPISIRSGDDDAAGNHVTAMAVPLGTDIAGAEERLRSVHEAATAAKAAMAEAGSDTLVSLAGLVPPPLTALAVKNSSRTGYANAEHPALNCAVSNVPGSPQPLYFAGSRMVATYGVGPIFHGLGLMNLATSYDGTIALSFTSNPRMMPDPEVYAEALRESFDALMGVARAPRRVVPPRHAVRAVARRAVRRARRAG